MWAAGIANERKGLTLFGAVEPPAVTHFWSHTGSRTVFSAKRVPRETNAKRRPSWSFNSRRTWCSARRALDSGATGRRAEISTLRGRHCALLIRSAETAEQEAAGFQGQGDSHGGLIGRDEVFDTSPSYATHVLA
ncbi:hypothetical protein MRX96_044226 [Rhipicephalus microplus]